jgi:hypothetical protein
MNALESKLEVVAWKFAPISNWTFDPVSAIRTGAEVDTAIEPTSANSAMPKREIEGNVEQVFGC